MSNEALDRIAEALEGIDESLTLMIPCDSLEDQPDGEHNVIEIKALIPLGDMAVVDDTIEQIKQQLDQARVMATEFEEKSK